LTGIEEVLPAPRPRDRPVRQPIPYRFPLDWMIFQFRDAQEMLDIGVLRGQNTVSP
jgi:hypothetical protein